ncbi:MAG: hypothetical protein ACSHWY_04765, partial [Octadecabacter sp.]
VEGFGFQRNIVKLIDDPVGVKFWNSFLRHGKTVMNEVWEMDKTLQNLTDLIRVRWALLRFFA